MIIKLFSLLEYHSYIASISDDSLSGSLAEESHLTDYENNPRRLANFKWLPE